MHNLPEHISTGSLVLQKNVFFQKLLVEAIVRVKIDFLDPKKMNQNV